MRGARPACALLAALLALSSCATLRPAYAPPDWLGVLPPESAVFAAAEVRTTRALLEAAAGHFGPEGGPDSRQLGRVLDRIGRVYAAVSFPAQGDPSFALIALGDFRPAALSCRLGCEADWRRVGPGRSGGGRPYWEHRRLPLQVAAPGPGVALVSNGGLPALLERFPRPEAGAALPALRLPDEAEELLQASALFAYLPKLPLGAGFPGQASPIRELWFGAAVDPAAPNGYLAEAVLRLEEEQSPRVLENLARLLLAAWMRSSGLDNAAGKLRAARIRAEGRAVRVDALPLSSEEILRLLAAYLPPRAE